MSPISVAAVLLLCFAALSDAGGSTPQRHVLRPHCGRNRAFAGFLANRTGPSSVKMPLTLTKRIVGGQTSDNGQWPWMVRLRYSNSSHSDLRVCSGTLIHPRWVLTAARCFRDKSTYDNPLNWLVRIGEHDMSLDKETAHADVSVRQVLTHPWSSYEHHNDDIALVELAEETRITDNKNVACLPDKSDKFPVGTQCFIAGWGQESVTNERRSDILRHVQVPVVSNVDCQAAYLELKKKTLDKNLDITSYPDLLNDAKEDNVTNVLNITNATTDNDTTNVTDDFDISNATSGINLENITNEATLFDLVYSIRESLVNIYSYYNITHKKMCTDVYEGNRSNCYGGPLMCRDADSAGPWIIAGVVAYSYGCANVDIPNVYFRVTAYLDWINGIVDRYTPN